MQGRRGMVMRRSGPLAKVLDVPQKRLSRRCRTHRTVSANVSSVGSA
jgi:hypothetical protein